MLYGLTCCSTQQLPQRTIWKFALYSFANNISKHKMKIQCKDLTQTPQPGIPQSMFKFGCVNMQSEKYITFLDSQTKNLVIMQPQNNYAVTRRPVTCHGALMHPSKNILVVYAQGPIWTLQIFNVEMKTKLRSCDFKDKILMIKWISDSKLAVITEKSFYHIPAESGGQDKLIFNLDSSFQQALKSQFGQIVGYSCCPNQQWSAVYMISTPDKGTTIEGRVQLTFADKQQLLRGFGCAFGRVPLHEQTPIVFVTLMKKEGGFELVVSQISTASAGLQKHKVTRDLPKDIIVDKDFPIEVLFTEKYQRIYAITKLGALLMFQPVRGELITKIAIAINDSLILARLNTKTEGFMAISKKGLLIRGQQSGITSPTKPSLTDLSQPSPITSSKHIPKLPDPTILTIGTPCATLIRSLPSSPLTQLPQSQLQFLKQFQSLLSQSPAAALIASKSFCKVHNAMTEQIATVFAKNDCYSQLTEFVLACMNENLPQNGSWQTAVIVWNVRNNPRVAEMVLDLGLLMAYEREVVREACEGQGFWEMALATVKEEELLANGNKAEVQRYIEMCVKAALTENHKKSSKYVQCAIRAIHDRSSIYDFQTIISSISQLDDHSAMYALSMKHPIPIQYVKYLVDKGKIDELCNYLKQVTESREAAGAATHLLANSGPETLQRVLDHSPEFSDPEIILESFMNAGNLGVLRQWLAVKTKSGTYNVLANKLARIAPAEDLNPPKITNLMDVPVALAPTSTAPQPPNSQSQQL